ncbi:MAG TPA: hypothetical protein VK071_01060 [Tissierellales bacterium]|nr:hypothetical protein [Tissierellales bacterium]
MSILRRREEMGIQKGMQEGMQKGIQKGMQEGMRKGIRERNLEITKNLLKEGTEIALVVKATDLSKSEVVKLNEEVNK